MVCEKYGERDRCPDYQEYMFVKFINPCVYCWFNKEEND